MTCPAGDHDCMIGCEGCHAPTPVRVNADGWCSDCQAINALEAGLDVDEASS